METLKYIYSLVAEWLKFAESKNIALIVFNSSIMLGLLTGLTTIVTWEILFKVSMLILFVFNLISIICVLCAVFPRIKKNLAFNKSYSPDDNLFFYADLAHYDTNQLLTALKDNYGESVDPTSTAQKALARQIVINSVIANLKYKWFKIAWWVTVVGIALSILSGLFGIVVLPYS